MREHRRNVERGRGDAGFTLIELMVVILIIAILMAIAIPTYLGARNRAENRSAQANLRSALDTAAAAFSSSGAFSLPPGAKASGETYAAYLAGQEPALEWVGGASNAPGALISPAIHHTGQVAIFRSSDRQAISLTTFAVPTGTCWYALDLEAPHSASPALSPLGLAPGVWYSSAPLSASHESSGCGAGFGVPPAGWHRTLANA